jgi:hypothetical protein
MLEDYFEEEEEEEQQQEASAEVAIKNSGQRAHPHCSAIHILFCGQRKGTVHKCARCDVDLCVVPCFSEYRTN